MVYHVKKRKKINVRKEYCYPGCVRDKVAFLCRHSLGEGGLKSPSWWAAGLFSRSRVMPDSISNTRQVFSIYANAATCKMY